MGDISDVAAAITPPKFPVGKSISIDMTPDHKISSFTLGVEYQDAANAKLLDARVQVSDGELAKAIDPVHNEAVALAVADGETPTIPDPEDAEGPEIANPNYPIKPDTQATWTIAQSKLNDALADAEISALPTLEKKLAAVAQKLVDLLLVATKAGTYPQKYGKRMLKKAYYAKASSLV